MGKRFENHIKKENVQMANKHLRKMFNIIGHQWKEN